MLQNSIQAAEDWYANFEELHVPDWTIKKWIRAGHAKQDWLKAKYDSVMASKEKIQLKFEEGDTRVLNKINKWNQVALDCRALVNTKDKCKFPPDRLHEIDELIDTVKYLDYVPEIKQVKQEFVKIKEWDGKIQALASTYPVDLVEMRTEIEKAKKVIPENYHTTFDYYLEQINTCEKWTSQADTLLESEEGKGSQEEALKLIKQVEDDREGDMKLINLDLYARVKAFAFSKIFELNDLEMRNKRTAKEFIKHIKKSLPKDLRIDTALVENELQVADLARRVKNYEMRRLDFEATFAEAQQLLGCEGTRPLPFIVPKKINEVWQDYLTKHTKIEAEIQSILTAGPLPKIETLNPLLAQLKKLKIRGETQKELQVMADDHSFVAEIW